MTCGAATPRRRDRPARAHRRDQVLVGVEQPPRVAVGVADQACRAPPRRAAAPRAAPGARSSSVARSSSSSGFSTWTVARESSAELTSNDGFSVVAPMKVKRPDSTCGRKASCWLLLKRWTSSTKTTVARARSSRRLRPLDRLADVLDAAEHRRHGDELGVEGVGHQARQRRLADARRPPQDHRVQPPGFERDAQRLAGAEQVALADDLVERLRPQPLGERRGGSVGEAEFERGLGHGRSRLARVAPILPRRPTRPAGRDIRCTRAASGSALDPHDIPRRSMPSPPC